MKRIAIVGGGMSGTSVLVHLVGDLMRRRARNVQIVLYESGKHLGSGNAYSADSPESFLLNHEISHMGSISLDKLPADDDKDFYRWAQANKEEFAQDFPQLNLSSPSTHVPRSLYGRYLQARFKEAVKVATDNGIQLQIRREDVSDITRSPGGLTITSDGGNGAHRTPFSSGVLALGHWYAKPLLSDQAPDRTYTAYPPQAYLESVDTSKSRLLIVGTGLTAVDAAIGAVESGKFSHVTMVSRRGQVRALRGPTESYTPQFLTLQNLETMAKDAGRDPASFTLADIATLLKKEMEHAYGEELDWHSIIAPTDMHGFLKKQLEDIDAGKELRWRSVIDALDPIRQQIYERLSPEEQAQFTTDWKNLYLSYRAAMPIENGRKLIDFMENGMLDIRNTQAITYDKTTGCFTHTDKTGAQTSADMMVDARGQSLDYHEQPLLLHLVDDTRLLKPNPAGGIATNNKTLRALSPEGQELPLYVLGAAAIGSYVNPPNTLTLAEAGRNIANQLSAGTPHKQCPR